MEDARGAFAIRQGGDETQAVRARAEGRVALESETHAVGDAPPDVEGVKPGAGAVRIACQVRQCVRVQKDRVCDARVVVRHPLRGPPVGRIRQMSIRSGTAPSTECTK